METVALKEPEPAYLPDIDSIPVRKEVIDNVIFHEWGVIEIPLLGSTAAGKPIDFGDLDPDPPTRPWAADLVRGDPKDYYSVLVCGTSMTEADIKDGDHALLRHANSPRNGEIMLVRHDNSSTLKRIKIVEGKNGQEETWICWEDGSNYRVKLSGEGIEIQGSLEAIERKPGKR
jgi:phage repressor protein C with HTH and peptisase S24 domain